MADPSPEVARLRALAEEAVAGRLDVAAELARTLRLVADPDTGVDPYIVIGILVEAITHMLEQRIPQERQAEVATATVQTLLHRLKARGLF